jgi:phage tail-like protein
MANYPIPKFHFRVEWGGTNIGFSEVSGMNIENKVIEYRDGISPEFSKIKMPGMREYSNISLKREPSKVIMNFLNGSIQYLLIRLIAAILLLVF